MIGVYVIHFEKPMFHASHYIGSSVNIPARLAVHHAGNGSPMLRAATERGIKWSLSHVMFCDNEHQARNLEKKIKRHKHNRDYCPLCRQSK